MLFEPEEQLKPISIIPPMPEHSCPSEPLCSDGTMAGYSAATQDSKWKTTRPVPLSRESFLSLLDGRMPLIKVSQFITEKQSRRLFDHLLPSFSPYLHATGPAVEKVGLAQFEFQAQSAEDFKNRKGNGAPVFLQFLPLEVYPRDY